MYYLLTVFIFNDASEYLNYLNIQIVTQLLFNMYNFKNFTKIL